MLPYNFAVDPVTKKKIVVFRCVAANGFPKNGFALAKNTGNWYYYRGDNIWSLFKTTNTLVFDTKEEAELTCTQHLNFLKECGYDFCYLTCL